MAKKQVRTILTAEEWQKRIAADEARANKEKRDFEKARQYELSVEDLRDEAVAIVRNTYGNGDGAFEKVHARMGAHPATLKKWDNKEVARPQMQKLRAVLRACGHDLVIRPL